MKSPGPGGNKEEIHLHALCWNDRRMIPYFFKHYNEIVDRYYIYDNGSTDGSLEALAGDQRVQVMHWHLSGDSFVDQARSLANTYWKLSRGSATWVFVVDLDEHLYHRELRERLRAYAANGTTVLKVEGYDMVAEQFPSDDRPLSQSVTRGIRVRDLDKLAIFDPRAIRETNYEVGRHAARPVGRVIWEVRHPATLLHYKWLGVDYVSERNEMIAARLRPRDLDKGYGFHHRAQRGQFVAQHSLMMRDATPVPALVRTATPAPEWSLEQEMSALRDSGLFESGWYLASYPDVSYAGTEPLEHFCLFGWRERRNPNRQFDAEWYIQTYGELIGDLNPLLDYVMGGESLGRKPSRDFDPAEYRSRRGLAASESPLRHYLSHASEDAAENLPLPSDFDSSSGASAITAGRGAAIDPSRRAEPE